MNTETLSKETQTKNKAAPSSKTATTSKQSTTPDKILKTKLDQKTSAVSNLTPTTLEDLICLSRKQLDAIYKQAKAGDMPQGDTNGTAILAGSPFPNLFAKLAKSLAWQGKVFDIFSPDYNSGVLVNKVSPLGFHLIVAKVYRGASWMDGKDTIIIDYSDTSLFAKKIRDEIREVKPGLYLGKVWWGKTRILDFALEAHKVV